MAVQDRDDASFHILSQCEGSDVGTSRLTTIDNVISKTSFCTRWLLLRVQKGGLWAPDGKFLLGQCLPGLRAIAG
jgi:hypothetical protein